LAEFRDGWRIGSLVTADHLRSLAAGHGLTLVRDLDLTPWLELRRPRDRFISVLVTLGRAARPGGGYWRSPGGGHAPPLPHPPRRCPPPVRPSGQALLEQGPFGRVTGQAQRLLVAAAGFVGPAQLAKKLGPRRVVEVVPAELGAEGVHLLQRGLGPEDMAQR